VPVKEMKEQVLKEVSEVAEKFKRQLIQLLEKNRDAEQNEELQERVRKGADYFSGKLEEFVLKKMEVFSVETDNKEIRKKIQKAEKRLLEEAWYKKACLEACREGFIVKDYLKERAMASLEEMPKKRSSKTEKLPVSKDIANAGLYELLKEWRNVRAQELGMPYFMVLPLKTMRALSNQVPSNMDELKRVHGFGRKKIEQFGEELLELLNEYRHDHELKIEPLPEPVKKKEKKPKINTREVSLKLWLQHKDIAKVALERGLTRATVEGHLAHYVGLGELQVEEFVDEEKIRKITKVMTEHNNFTLAEIKAKLGDDVSYGELKMVRQHLLWLGKSKSI